ncbi:MAG: cobalt ECF transporter T component CbiQ [Methanobacteriota archaeon]|nr:MAG: cobalt ECF transporter T component CbiQ [Euryarchaeota archaeon]
MSGRTYTKHMPDVRMIAQYAERGTSVVHSINPWTKAFVLILVVALVTVVTDLAALLAIYALTVAFYVLARLPVSLLIGWYAIPILFVVTLVIMFVFTEPGDEIVGFELGSRRVAVTDNGLLLMAKLVVRALAVVTFSLATFMTIRYKQVVYIACKTMPAAMATMFLLTYRFLFVATDELTNILDTIHSRNGSLVKGIARQTRMFGGIFSHAFVHAFDRAERISKAMESRGFDGEFPVAERVPGPGAKGFVAVSILTVILAVAVIDRYLGVKGW